MKITFFTLITIMFFAGISSCNYMSQKINDLLKSDNEQSILKPDSTGEYELFKKISEERISNNEIVIAAYKTRMVTDKLQMKAIDSKIIDGLEKKNMDMRNKIEEYKNKGVEEWEIFKMEFNQGMDELGHAMNHLNVKNKKNPND